ncbi:terminase large subunit domain-containing protein [Roseovarius sp.]|uniref:terminase large subunit domain-containing protein n=1 Tax=Roseovarius sp. TaxID=1486281 RepID=UPI003BAD1C1E
MTAQLTAAQRRWALESAIPALTTIGERKAQRLFYCLFPDEDSPAPPAMHGYFPTGVIHAREKYQRHLEFFEAGEKYRERCFMAANRVGKTFSAGGYEMACHLTGEYPDWWPGRRFNRPIRAWAAGKWNETTRDIVQATLLGQIAFRSGRKAMDGTGVIPGHAIGAITWKQGITDLVDTVRVRHVSGGWSTLGLKSYQQGRGSFEGTSQHVIWLDEECPLDVYGECLIRTATTNGLVMLTFTPLEGMSETVLQFLPDDMRPGI